MPTTIAHHDPRFPLVARSRNGRFAGREQGAGQIALCHDAEDVARALQQVIDAGVRPTVRASGHCYEDFVVDNPGGTIIDVGHLATVTVGPQGAGPYTLGAGAMIGPAYAQLHRLANRTFPGGTCPSVAVGGLISGGGYGPLSRRDGLVVDHVSAADIVTVDRHHRAVPIRADHTHHPELLRALRGAGGGNFGIVTAFHFDALPVCPSKIVNARISWSWDDLSADRFVAIVTSFGDYWAAATGARANPGLFSLMMLAPPPGRVSIGLQFTDADGTAADLAVVRDYLSRFDRFEPTIEWPPDYGPSADDAARGPARLVIRDWLEAAVGARADTSVAIAPLRAKYKSAYRKQAFTPDDALVFHRALRAPTARGMAVAVTSHGGAINDPARVLDTAIPQRSSTMLMHFQSYWQDPRADDEQLAALRELYAASCATPSGTPYPDDRFDGCYINYPDVDLLQHPWWAQLYYGTGTLLSELQAVKATYDPYRVFRHAMSIPI